MSAEKQYNIVKTSLFIQKNKSLGFRIETDAMSEARLIRQII